MGYEIHYDRTGEMRRVTTYKKSIKKAVGLFALIAALLLLYNAFSAEINVTVTALEGMAGSMQEGSSVKEAFSEFCLDVLEGADIG